MLSRGAQLAQVHEPLAKQPGHLAAVIGEALSPDAEVLEPMQWADEDTRRVRVCTRLMLKGILAAREARWLGQEGM